VRDQAVKSALNREGPSAAAEALYQRAIQRPGNPDAVYNWRPLSLWPPPISIYHPLFAQFAGDVSADPNSLSFSSSELDEALGIIQTLLDIYPQESLRRQKIGATPLFFKDGKTLLTPTTFMRDETRFFSPDGHRTSHIPALDIVMPCEITEINNEIGEARSDSMTQAECDYVCLHSSDDVSH